MSDWEGMLWFEDKEVRESQDRECPGTAYASGTVLFLSCSVAIPPQNQRPLRESRLSSTSVHTFRN